MHVIPTKENNGCLEHYLQVCLLPSLPLSLSTFLLRADLLELASRVEEVVGIGLGSEASRVGLLDEVLVALLLGKRNGILLGLEVHVGALHVVTRRLPAHQRVLPAVALGEDVPVHAPVVALPVTGLRSGFRLLVDAASLKISQLNSVFDLSVSVPDSASLQLEGSARSDRGRVDILSAVLDALRNGGEGAAG